MSLFVPIVKRRLVDGRVNRPTNNGKNIVAKTVENAISINEHIDQTKWAMLNDLHEHNYSEFLWCAIQKKTATIGKSLFSLIDAVEIDVRKRTYTLGLR